MNKLSHSEVTNQINHHRCTSSQISKNQKHNENTSNTHPELSRLKNMSMAAENAANAKPPPKAALGPEFRARIPPTINPAATGLTMSFFARYYRVDKIMGC